MRVAAPARQQSTLPPPRSIAPAVPSSDRFVALFDRINDQVQPLAGVTTERDWNFEWQAVLAQPDSKEKFARMRDLELDFVHVATMYGKIIIPQEESEISRRTSRVPAHPPAVSD